MRGEGGGCMGTIGGCGALPPSTLHYSSVAACDGVHCEAGTIMTAVLCLCIYEGKEYLFCELRIGSASGYVPTQAQLRISLFPVFGMEEAGVGEGTCYPNVRGRRIKQGFLTEPGIIQEVQLIIYTYQWVRTV